MNTNNTTTTNKPAEQIKAMPSATYRAFVDRAQALATADKSTAQTVEEARWQRFTTTTDMHAGLGAFLLKSIAPKVDAKNVTGEAIRKALADKSSGLYVDAEHREALPSASVLSRAMDVARFDSADRRKRFQEKGNSPSTVDYIYWCKVDEDPSGKLLGNKSSVDVAKTVTGTGKKRETGKLVKVPSAKTPKVSTAAPTAPTVVGFFSDLLSMSTEELAAIIADGPDLSHIPADRLRDVARTAMAMVVKAEQTERLVVTI